MVMTTTSLLKQSHLFLFKLLYNDFETSAYTLYSSCSLAPMFVFVCIRALV